MSRDKNVNDKTSCHQARRGHLKRKQKIFQGVKTVKPFFRCYFVDENENKNENDRFFVQEN